MAESDEGTGELQMQTVNSATRSGCDHLETDLKEERKLTSEDLISTKQNPKLPPVSRSFIPNSLFTPLPGLLPSSAPVIPFSLPITSSHRVSTSSPRMRTTLERPPSPVPMSRMPSLTGRAREEVWPQPPVLSEPWPG
jgi:hypothetical protein